jgi:hypothetical protein
MVIALPVFLERMSGLLPAETKPLPQGEPFEKLFLLNFENLCDDFHENIEFRSSEVLSNICRGSETAFNLAREFKSQKVSLLYIIVCVTGNGLI